ncbi:LPS translocon maturation chaperone LptM [Ferrovum sp. PN-J185]|uniref:LPS translocon maturation chaperone LptM n=1 Tax=Ferrovum sp. PN-J185 TaxID=1356306 RepID=UPI003B63698F
MKNIYLVKISLIVIPFAILLNSCGLRGPLYLPPKTTPKESTKPNNQNKQSLLIVQHSTFRT